MFSPAIFEKKQYTREVSSVLPIEAAGSGGIGPETMRFAPAPSLFIDAEGKDVDTAIGRNIMSVISTAKNAFRRILPGEDTTIRDSRRTVLISAGVKDQNITLETYIPLLDMTVADVLQLTYGEEYLP
jgi:hypothetical protein